MVIDLDVPREIVLERISARRVCRDCGTNYTGTGTERSPWICEVCGGDVMQRDDDTPDAVNRRLDLYESQTAPLIEYYGRQGRLAVINGVGHPDHVFRRLTDVVDVAPVTGRGTGPQPGLAGPRADWCSGFAPVALRVGLPRGHRFPCPSYRTSSTRESGSSCVRRHGRSGPQSNRIVVLNI